MNASSPTARRELLLVSIRQDLHRVAQLTERPEGVAPDSASYEQHGRHTVRAVRLAVTDGFQRDAHDRTQPTVTWCEAVTRFGFTPVSQYAPTHHDIAADIWRLVVSLGKGPHRMPSQEEYRRQGQWPPAVAIRVVVGEDGTWSELAETLALDVKRGGGKHGLDQETLIEEFQRIATALGYEPGGPGPTTMEFGDRAPYTHQAAAYHFGGSWARLVEAAGFVRRGRGKRRAG